MRVIEAHLFLTDHSPLVILLQILLQTQEKFHFQRRA